MKKIITMGISICIINVAKQAQVKREVNPSQTTQSTIQKKKNGKMMKELNLSKEQRSQMKELHQSMKQQNCSSSISADIRKMSLKNFIIKCLWPALIKRLPSSVQRKPRFIGTQDAKAQRRTLMINMVWM